MLKTRRKFALLLGPFFGPVLGLSLGFLSACSSAKTAPEESGEKKQKEEFKTLRMLHPVSLKASDLKSLFSLPECPAPDAIEKCDFDYYVEKRLARSKSALFMVLPQYVYGDPAKYHWCFYWKVRQLAEETVSGQEALASVEFLADIARIFQSDFDDSQYLKNAIQAYQDLSRKEFFTLLRVSAETGKQLLETQESGE